MQRDPRIHGDDNVLFFMMTSTTLALIFSLNLGLNHSTYSYGIELASEGDSLVYVAWIDSTSDAFSKGVRTGDELIAWNQLPILQARDQVVINEAKEIASDSFRHILQLYQLTKKESSEVAHIYYTNDAGNHRGVAIHPGQSSETISPYPLPVTGNSTFIWKEITNQAGSPGGLLIDLRENMESVNVLEDVIQNRYPDLPIMIVQGPLTTTDVLDRIYEWTKDDQVTTIGHWPADGFTQLIGSLPDILIPANRMVWIDYYRGWDPLVDEAKIHLLRLTGDQSERR